MKPTTSEYIPKWRRLRFSDRRLDDIVQGNGEGVGILNVHPSQSRKSLKQQQFKHRYLTAESVSNASHNPHTLNDRTLLSKLTRL